MRSRVARRSGSIPEMPIKTYRRVVSRRAGWIVAGWFLAAALIALGAPSLTRLAAEGQDNLLPKSSESVRMAELVARAWPHEAYQSMAVVALHRPGGLTEPDRQFARRLAGRFDAGTPGRPGGILRVLGPGSEPEVAARLAS